MSRRRNINAVKWARHRGAVLVVVLLGITAPTAAHAITVDVPEPPGLDDRVTHMTLLETREWDCYELNIPRTGNLAAIREAVPERYQPVVLGAPPDTYALLRTWDYVCRDLTVDGQPYAPMTQISLGGVSLASRDGQLTSGTFYLLWIGTDNAVLAARYAQVGLPATFVPDMRSSVSELPDVPYVVSFDVPGRLGHTVAGAAGAPPQPQAVTDSRVTLYHEGASGEVALAYANQEIAAVGALITADYRENQVLVPLIRFDRLLQIGGTVVFPNSLIRGSWNATVFRTS
jgi:hypothetical protein